MRLSAFIGLGVVPLAAAYGCQADIPEQTDVPEETPAEEGDLGGDRRVHGHR